MKKFLRSLDKKDYALYLVLLLLLITGMWLRGFWGGFVAGASGPLLFCTIVGKLVFAKTVARIDKQVKDHLVQMN